MQRHELKLDYMTGKGLGCPLLNGERPIEVFSTSPILRLVLGEVVLIWGSV
jgi:hypothetical protein